MPLPAARVGKTEIEIDDSQAIETLRRRGQFERAQNVEERFHKDFDGFTFLNDKSANAGVCLQVDNSGPMKMNVLSVVVGTIATISAILGLA